MLILTKVTSHTQVISRQYPIDIKLGGWGNLGRNLGWQSGLAIWAGNLGWQSGLAIWAGNLFDQQLDQQQHSSPTHTKPTCESDR